MSDENPKRSHSSKSSKSTKISVRLRNELYTHLDPNNVTESLETLLLKAINAKEDDLESEMKNLKQIQDAKKYLTILLKLFQKNAKRIEITDNERQSVKEMLEWVKKL